MTLRDKPTWALVFFSESIPPPAAVDNMLRHFLSSAVAPESQPSTQPTQPVLYDL